MKTQMALSLLAVALLTGLQAQAKPFYKVYTDETFIEEDSEYVVKEVSYKGVPPSVEREKKISWCQEQVKKDSSIVGSNTVPVRAFLNADQTECHVSLVEISEIENESVKVYARTDFDFSRKNDPVYLKAYFKSEVNDALTELSQDYPEHDVVLSHVEDFDFPNSSSEIGMHLIFKLVKRNPFSKIDITAVYPLSNKAGKDGIVYDRDRIRQELNDLMTVLWPQFGKYKISYQNPQILNGENGQTFVLFNILFSY